MKKSDFIYLFVLLASIVCLDACKKKEDPAPASKELLANTSGKKWKVTSATVTGVGDVLSDFVKECERDNLFVFYTDNTLVIEEGALQCNPTTAATGTWKLSTDEKTLTIDAGSANIFSGDFTIVQIESTTLKGTFIYQGATVNATLAAQ